MSNIKGTAAYLLVADQGSPSGTFTKLEGQTNTTWDGSTNVADTTDKDGNGWQTAVSTTISGTINAEGNFKSSGNRTQLNKLKDAWIQRNSIECQILLDTDQKYQGYFYVTQFQVSADVNDVAKYAITLQAAEALVEVNS